MTSPNGKKGKPNNARASTLRSGLLRWSVERSDGDTKSLMRTIEALSDLAIIVDRNGVIEEAFGESETLSTIDASAWTGRRFDDMMDRACLADFREIAKAKANGDKAATFVVRHVRSDGESVTFRLTSLAIGVDLAVLLVGQILTSPDECEGTRPSARAGRAVEHRATDVARYHSLFKSAWDAVAVINAQSGRVCDLSQPAADILGLDSRRVAGRSFKNLFDRADRPGIADRLAEVVLTGMPTTLFARSGRNKQGIAVTVNRSSALDASELLIQLEEADDGQWDKGISRSLLTLVRRANEAIVLTDHVGMIVWANEAFVAIVGAGDGAAVKARPVGDFFDSAEMDIEIVLANVRLHGPIKMLRSELRGMTGQTSDVELSIISLPMASQIGFGIVLRDLSMRLPSEGGSPRPSLFDTVAAPLAGETPMQDWVRSQVDTLEKDCIEAALALTGNNRAATAKSLGLSRQGLYSKMRRYGIE